MAQPTIEASASTDERGNSADTPIPEWILTPYEEKQIRQRCQTQAEEKCYKEFVRMGACAEQHQVLFSWKCRDQKKDLFECIAHWGSEPEFLKLRDLYITEKKEKLRNEKA